MIALKHGCYCSELKVTPANWKTVKASTVKPWILHYRFYDPEVRDAAGKIKSRQVMIKGMNKYSELKQRQAATAILLEETFEMLKAGYNPHLKKPVMHEATYELDPDTPLIEALQYGLKRVVCVHDFRIILDSMLKYVTAAAKKMRYDLKPISEIETRHMIILFDYMREHDKAFTNTKHNRYRSYLSMIFKPLKKMGLVKYNPMQDVDIMKKTKMIRKTLTLEDRKKVDAHLKKVNPLFHRLMIIFFHSGGRETEIMRVQGKDVDLKKQTYRCIVKKGKNNKEVERTIKTIALPFWEAALKDCGPEDYVFSKSLKPGPSPINPRQITRRWRLWVKDDKKRGIGIEADFYSLKHSNSTEIVEMYDAETAAYHNSHTSTDMVDNVYDIRNYNRKHEKMKKANNDFV